MEHKEIKVYLQHILDEIYRIEVFLQDYDEFQFLDEDPNETHYAVVRCLEIIGEATNKLQKEFIEENPQIPWKEIVNMRNKIIHEYMAVDYEVVWTTCQEDLKPLREFIETYLGVPPTSPEK
jgi:uncharacterized protein with HEPN domain